MEEIVIILLLALLVVILYYKRTSSFVDDNIQVVVAAYNEDMNWLKEEPFNGLDTICYNKGKNDMSQCEGSHCKIVKLPNVGRCDHTYLHHIIENYDSLAPVTVFIPASWTDSLKKSKTLELIENARTSKKTNIPNTPISPNDGVWGFQMDEWTSSNEKNKDMNETSSLQPCPQRPFGVWYRFNFPDTPLTHIQYSGIFAVARDDIIQHPIERYRNLIRYLDSHSNPEAGHYIERAWHSIFSPIST
jgi:hypothetical protein